MPHMVGYLDLFYGDKTRSVEIASSSGASFGFGGGGTYTYHAISFGVMFSNGQQLVGATFHADTQLMGKDGTVLWSYDFSTSIGMAGFHGAVERRLTAELELSDDQVNSIDIIRVRFFVNQIADVNGSAGGCQ